VCFTAKKEETEDLNYRNLHFMNGQYGKEKLKEYIGAIQPVLGEFLDSEIEKSKEFGDVQVLMIQTYKDMITAGKGIRGFLVKLGYEVCGGTESEKIIQASPFMELFHSAILMQDDFMDRDGFRRGLPAAHVVLAEKGEQLGVKVPPLHYGYSVAVCLSDAGIYLSWKKLIESGFDPESVIRASKIYYDYVVRLALGQSLDLTITGQENITEEEVLKVIWTKSGEYTALLPLLSGAALAGEENEEKLNNIKEYAKCFGWAFHIQDDILGLFGDESKLGKPIGSDLKEAKNTLLMLHLRKNGTPEQIEFQNELLGNENITPEQVEKMKQILIDAGSYDYVYELGLKYVDEGKKYIPLITKNEELQKVLESLLVYMMERVK
jgi:geranylgeranyl pyrophosphate synthase